MGINKIDYPLVADEILAEHNKEITKHDEIIQKQKELIDMYLYSAKATLWKDIPDNIESSIELMNTISELKKLIEL
jgi:hypothetical protein